MNFCPTCGAPVRVRIPVGDNRPRHVCTRCGRIHYQNPRIIAGCVPVWQDKVLLCQRAIEPRLGLWTLPAGFMENGETLAEAAARETLEEACATVAVQHALVAASIPHINQVYVMFVAALTDGKFAAGEESREVALFTQSAIPWREIAFPSIGRTLEIFFAERGTGNRQLHNIAIRRQPHPGGPLD